MEFLMIMWVAFGISCYLTDKKMDAYREHVKACKKKGIKHDESMWVPR